MKKRCLKVLSLSVLLSTFAFTGCGNKIKITFIGDNGEIVRTIKEGETLSEDKIPNTPQVKGKYCLWDEVDYESLTEDVSINYTCYDSVSSLTSNISTDIEVEIGSEEASLDYILKDLRMTAVLEGGNSKNLYKDDIKINTNGYNKDVSGTYRIGLAYNNKEIFINVRVKKINHYVTAVLGSDTAYLNEGLPTITANTSVPGTIKFDENQTLMIGTVAYNWTFTPEDTNKYEIIKGKSSVNVINIKDQTLTTNKSEEVMTFEYGTSKQDIINAIKDGLVVTGMFDLVYREIDSKYYTITSDYVEGETTGDNIPFRVTYDANYDPAIVYVNVKKNENYTLNVTNISDYIITSETTLNDVLNDIDDYYEPSIPGAFTFDQGQTLKVGSYTYSYTFTPDDRRAAPRSGEIVIETKKIVDINSNSGYVPSYDYGEYSVEEITEQIKSEFVGTFVYNDGSVVPCINALVNVVIDHGYDAYKPGEYSYFVEYDDVVVEFTFRINKRVLKEDVDFYLSYDMILDEANPTTMPECDIVSINNDFDASKFTVVPDLSKDIEIEGDTYIFFAKIIPNEDVSDDFEIVDVELPVTRLPGGPAQG